MAKGKVTKVITEDKILPARNWKSIEAHKVASEHLFQAANQHLNAATHYEAGLHEKASYCGVIAQGHISLANDTLLADAKLHAQLK